MNPTALIAEDEPLLAADLRQALQRLWPGLDIVATVGDGLQAVTQALALQPTLVFLDIRMPGCSGLEAAAALAEDWPQGPGAAPFPLLVFVTAYDEHALAAFEAQAADYLVKPLDPARLAASVHRLQTRLAERETAAAAPAQVLDAAVAQLRALIATQTATQTATQPAGAGTPPVPRLEVIQAQAGSVVHFVPVDEVIYFEAADKYVRVVTAAREHLIRQSLRELLPQLDPAQFWQVHRGTVVQARCIVQARREESGKVTLTLRGRPETVTASRLHAHLFKGL
ncbi:MAG: LytR/AlgR family response regulator transcription factor [Rubrivivax sp.]